MISYTLTHLSDVVLLRDLASLVAHDRVTTAAVLTHIAEVDSRRLYAPAGYPSMHAYCVGELRLSEDAASKRIQAARAARQFPLLFDALAEGRLHLAAVCLLAPHLTAENVEQLVEAATHRSKAEIEEWLARFFPRPELPSMAGAIHLPEHAPAHVERDPFPCGAAIVPQHAPGHVEDVRVGGAAAPERFLLQLTIGKGTRDKLRYAQALLSHAVPSGDVAQVLDRALDALIVELEKRKLGAGTRLRAKLGPATPSGRRLHTPPVGERSVVTSMVARSRPTTRSRYVPARVRRAVWGRDGGQCTFVGASGHRCESRRFLEFDHIDPVARGGRASVEGMRLRCRAHNQYEAESTFGAGFMSQKRHEARGAAAEARARAAHNMPRGMLEVTDAGERATQDQIQDVLAGLRNLGCRADEARRAALAGDLQDVTLEDRMRAALTFLSRR
jgi:5-methylcytosine-specific restriction endonuclease McrA